MSEQRLFSAIERIEEAAAHIAATEETKQGEEEAIQPEQDGRIVIDLTRDDTSDEEEEEEEDNNTYPQEVIVMEDEMAQFEEPQGAPQPAPQTDEMPWEWQVHNWQAAGPDARYRRLTGVQRTPNAFEEETNQGRQFVEYIENNVEGGPQLIARAKYWRYMGVHPFSDLGSLSGQAVDSTTLVFQEARPFLVKIKGFHVTDCCGVPEFAFTLHSVFLGGDRRCTLATYVSYVMQMNEEIRHAKWVELLYNWIDTSSAPAEVTAPAGTAFSTALCSVFPAARQRWVIGTCSVCQEEENPTRFMPSNCNNHFLCSRCFCNMRIRADNERGNRQIPPELACPCCRRQFRKLRMVLNYSY